MLSKTANGLARRRRNKSIRVIPTLFRSHVLKRLSLAEVFQPRSLIQEGWQICQHLACEKSLRPLKENLQNLCQQNITPVLREGEVPPPLGPFCAIISAPGRSPPLPCAIQNLGPPPSLVQFKVAEYPQIRNKNKICFCGICFQRFLGKDFGNRPVSIYTTMNLQKIHVF